MQSQLAGLNIFIVSHWLDKSTNGLTHTQTQTVQTILLVYLSLDCGENSSRRAENPPNRYCKLHTVLGMRLKEMKLDEFVFLPQRNLPFSVGPAAVTRPGRCAGAGGAAGQKCVLHALEVTGLWWARQPAAGRPCRRHWMDRVWTPPPQDTEH